MPSPERFTLIGVPAEQRLARFGRDVAAGLTASPKHLSCCYFYDRLGSLLFEAICELPEYYVTRAETAIFEAHADEIAALFPAATDLIELGSGNARKTRLLLEAFLRRQRSQRYLPLDICRTVLEDSSQDLLQSYPSLEIVAIAAEYHEGLKHLERMADRGKLVLWLGSNIGNLARPAAARFLTRVRAILSPRDRVLIGFDLRKDSTTLEAAYDDPCGVTAAFNRNVLGRINRELGGHFDLSAFRHRTVYNDEAGRIEMYLVSAVTQHVSIDQLGLQVSFHAGEAIHTEDSYKYSPAEIAALGASAGLHVERSWSDTEGKFQVVLFGVSADA
jgi:dimethylhistidine N-methyltransferase